MAVYKDLIPNSLNDEARDCARIFIELQQKLDNLILRTPSGGARNALSEANIHAMEAASKIHWHCRSLPGPYAR